MDTFERASPMCPHCGYEMDHDDMNSDFSKSDLFALAPDEGRAVVTCPQCDREYWVEGGYVPHYTSALAEEDL